MPGKAADQSAPLSDGFGINLIGNLSGGVGLGVICRAIATLLKKRRVPFSVLDVPHAWGSPQPVSGLDGHLVSRPEELPHPVSLYVLPCIFYETLFDNNPALVTAARFHVANLWWEASRLPTRWIDILSRFDAVLAMSDFIADTCRNQLPMTPTICGEAPLELPGKVRGSRADFGLPADAVVFVASLDPNSDPTRKNPEGLVSAFRAAFPDSDDKVRLVIRLNNADTDVGRFIRDRLLQLAGGDGRIGLLLAPMSYETVLSLYASADVFVSLHRGEGLGLGMLEAMALGKPVIATGWSGNLGFMNHGNSALLRYRLVPVFGIYDFFRPEALGSEARWADPVPEDAVAWMQRLRANPELRREFGLRGRRSAAEYRAKAATAHWLGELDALWRTSAFLPSVVEKLSYRGTPVSPAGS